MDIQYPAANMQATFAEAQDNASLRARANAQLATLAVTIPAGRVNGFDAGCMGGGATWCVACYIDDDPPAMGPPFSVLLGNARVFTAEALDEATLQRTYLELKQQIADVSPTALIACSRLTGGGAGGKYLIALLVNLNPQT